MIVRVLLTVLLGLIGLLLALPISYFFQSDLYEFYTLSRYVLEAPDSIMFAAQFGAWDVYRITAIVTVISLVVIMNVAETLFLKKR